MKHELKISLMISFVQSSFFIFPKRIFQYIHNILNEVKTTIPIHNNKFTSGSSFIIEIAKPSIANVDQIIFKFSMFEYASIPEFLPKYDSMPIPNKAAAKIRVVTGSMFFHWKYPNISSGIKNKGIATEISTKKCMINQSRSNLGTIVFFLKSLLFIFILFKSHHLQF